jgi:surface protein
MLATPDGATDPLVLRLDNETIRAALKEHQEAICNGTFFPAIGAWDVSRVTNMDDLFLRLTGFNEPIGGWDTSGVRSMRGMFERCKDFNQPIGGWNTGNVTSMSRMFLGAERFNRELLFDTRRVADMSDMFRDANEFNNGVADELQRGRGLHFDTRNVLTMRGMFAYAVSFTQVAHLSDMRAVMDMREFSLHAHRFAEFYTGNFWWYKEGRQQDKDPRIVVVC